MIFQDGGVKDTHMLAGTVIIPLSSDGEAFPGHGSVVHPEKNPATPSVVLD